MSLDGGQTAESKRRSTSTGADTTQLCLCSSVMDQQVVVPAQGHRGIAADPPGLLCRCQITDLARRSRGTETTQQCLCSSAADSSSASRSAPSSCSGSTVSFRATPICTARIRLRAASQRHAASSHHPCNLYRQSAASLNGGCHSCVPRHAALWQRLQVQGPRCKTTVSFLEAPLA